MTDNGLLEKGRCNATVIEKLRELRKNSAIDGF
jgi:hypothetical protein